MQLNHVALRREMKAQRWTVTAMAAELASRGVAVHRTLLSSIVNGSRPASFDVIKGLAAVLNLNPYGLLGPEDPKRAVRELVDLYGLTEADLFAAVEADPAHVAGAA